jgi:hypothetical protein
MPDNEFVSAKQVDLFGNAGKPEEQKYTEKVLTPIYEPKNKCPHVLELCDASKTRKLITEIKESNVSDEIKDFLILAAQRHIAFNYSKIADFYAHSSKEIQKLMERSALVIIDFELAIQYGYVKLCEDITKQYLTEYADENK